MWCDRQRRKSRVRSLNCLLLQHIEQEDARRKRGWVKAHRCMRGTVSFQQANNVIDAATTRWRVGCWKWWILKERLRFSESGLTFSSTNAIVMRYISIFKFSYFTISYFRIFPTLFLVGHLLSKAISRPIRITKPCRRTTNLSRDVFDFRIFTFYQCWPHKGHPRSKVIIPCHPVWPSEKFCLKAVRSFDTPFLRYSHLKFWVSSYPFWPLGVIQDQRSRWIWKGRMWFPISA